MVSFVSNFDLDDYEVNVVRCAKLYGSMPEYCFSCIVGGMRIVSEKKYTTPKGAEKAAERWLRKMFIT